MDETQAAVREEISSGCLFPDRSLWFMTYELWRLFETLRDLRMISSQQTCMNNQAAKQNRNESSCNQTKMRELCFLLTRMLWVNLCNERMKVKLAKRKHKRKTVMYPKLGRNLLLISLNKKTFCITFLSYTHSLITMISKALLGAAWLQKWEKKGKVFGQLEVVVNSFSYKWELGRNSRCQGSV